MLEKDCELYFVATPLLRFLLWALVEVLLDGDNDATTDCVDALKNCCLLRDLAVVVVVDDVLNRSSFMIFGTILSCCFLFFSFLQFVEKGKTKTVEDQSNKTG